MGPAGIVPLVWLLIACVLSGLASGGRTFLAPALLAWAVAFAWLPLDGTTLHWVDSGVFRWLLTVLAVLELLGDKSPRAPSRKQPAAVVARLLSGGGCGALLALATGHAPWVGIVVGAGAAVAGTWGGFALRRRLAERLGHDLPAALIEDALVLMLAAASVMLAMGGSVPG